MSILLIELKGSPEFNRTIWPPHLYIYDDLIIYKKRSWFRLREITISYNQIARVTLTKGLLFGFLELETTGSDNIVVRYISKKKGTYAKTIIDQKIYRSHAKHAVTADKNESDVQSYERSVNRLNELLTTGRITESEFKSKRNELLKKIE